MTPMNPSPARDVLNKQRAQELLRSPLLMRLAYVGLDDYPRVIPIGYLWNGQDFVVCTAEKAAKVRALAANPRVAITINTDSHPPLILLVRGTRQACVGEADRLRDHAATRRRTPSGTTRPIGRR